MEKIKRPIVTVTGHVDHGKTSILDNIRKTAVASEEAGGITQKISFTLVPIERIINRCQMIIENFNSSNTEKLKFSNVRNSPLRESNFGASNNKKINLEIPGFLFIDTPGHAAFSHLRKRGGNLADLAILVIDINEGIMPQTIEVLELLRLNKTPFIIALNKIDNISGWRKYSDDLKKSIDQQNENIKLDFNEKLLTIISSLYHHGFNAKPFYEISDFSTQLSLVPCSAKTGEGISELIMMLCGLSQKFLKQNLKLGEIGKGVILEIKKEKSMHFVEAILYDGMLNIKEEIAIGSFGEPIISKIRVLEEISSINNKFVSVSQSIAATGIRMQLINSENLLPGMPFIVYNNNLEEIKTEFEKEIGEKIKTDNEGIIIKADSLGSLEALITLLKEENVKILFAGIGNINKKDIITAQANLKFSPENSIILGFNVEEDKDIKDLEKSRIWMIKNDVIYKLIEDLLKTQENIRNNIRRERITELSTIGKIKILKEYLFRNSNPAIFGVRIEAGKIKPGVHLINESGKEISKIKGIQDKNNQLQEANLGQEIAISLPGVNFERELNDSDYLYTNLTESQYKKFKENKDLLTPEELSTLQKIAEIKRAKNISWGIP
jgi:translation initiation factor 5B